MLFFSYAICYNCTIKKEKQKTLSEGSGITTGNEPMFISFCG